MSNIKELIKQFVEEQLLIEEKKDHPIKKIHNLSDSEKDELIRMFKKHPERESMVDWNNYKILEMADFDRAIGAGDPLKELKKLKKNKDYVEVPGVNAPGLIGVYIPLNWEASQLLASKKIGGTRGKWCISHSEDSSYWNSYTYGLGSGDGYESEFIMFIYDDDKFAVQVKHNKGYSGIEVIEIWDKDDENHGVDDIVPGVDIKHFVHLSGTRKLLEDVRDELDKEKGPSFDIGDMVYFSNDDGYEVQGRINFDHEDGNYDIDYTDTFSIPDTEVTYADDLSYTPIGDREEYDDIEVGDTITFYSSEARYNIDDAEVTAVGNSYVIVDYEYDGWSDNNEDEVKSVESERVSFDDIKELNDDTFINPDEKEEYDDIEVGSIISGTENSWNNKQLVNVEVTSIDKENESYAVYTITMEIEELSVTASDIRLAV